MYKLRLLFALAVLAFATSATAQTKITMWSHWAAEKIKRDYVEDAIKRFEAANPGVKIEASWYEKTALYAALKTALRAGTAPDFFYAEPDQFEYMENGLLLDLSSLNWAAIEPWAKEAWSYKGKPYGVPLEAWTVEVYYNRKTLGELGVKVPANLQLDSQAFLELAKKARAKNTTPMSLGVGDRPYPGAHLTHEALLKKLGVQDYDNLLKGKLSWSDPRVVDTLKLVKTWVDAGMLPTTFTSLKLGEAHTYFHTKPGAVMFLNGSWYTSRARPGRPAGGLSARGHEVPGDPGRRVQRVPHDRGRRELRRQRRDEAAQARARVPQRLRDARDGEPLARERARPDRHQGRPFEDQRAARRLLQGARRHQPGREVLLRHPDPGHAGQAEGGLHAGDQQRLPGGHDRGRRGREADERGLQVTKTPGR